MRIIVGCRPLSVKRRFAPTWFHLRGAAEIIRDRVGQDRRCSMRRIRRFGSSALAAYPLRLSAEEASPLNPEPRASFVTSSGRGRASPRASSSGFVPDFRRARRLTLRRQSVRHRRRFRATITYRSERLPPMRSSTLHRGSNRVFPFNRLRAFALHPCRESELFPARHEQTRRARTNAFP